jgi:hypothetical protein
LKKKWLRLQTLDKYGDWAFLYWTFWCGRNCTLDIFSKTDLPVTLIVYVIFCYLYLGIKYPWGTILICIVLIFLIRLGEGVGVQLGPLGTSASNWPIVLVPGDYMDGEFYETMIGRGNRNTGRKSALVPLCPPQIPHDLTGREPGPPRWEASD